jgi:predicted DNA-binding protein with PD1-like motif
MQYKRLNHKVIVRIDKGEELVDSLKTLCKDLDITLGTIVGIGATNKVTIGLFNTLTKKYQTKDFTGDHEITSLNGNITTMNNEPYLHLHITLCTIEHKAVSGHLNSAVISATFEGVIDIIDGKVTREFNDDVGLNLMSFP